MPEIFYKDKNIVIRRSIFADVWDLAENVREADRREMYASHHLNPKLAISESFKVSTFTLTVLLKGKLVLMCGICPVQLLGDEALIWMIATDEMDKMKFSFLKHSRKVVNILLSFYKVNFNYVHAVNLKSIAWLERLGAEIHPAQPYGIEQENFHFFEFRRT